ncbi:response regulator [Microvirga sp. 2TAF3]|uniref:response regulator n=1 Tax=Microvirga sp. 2TAF3 TaxID=3233014 RepID=UPI003F9EA3C4
MDQLAGRIAIFDSPEPPAIAQMPIHFPSKAPVVPSDDELRHAQRTEAFNRLRDGIAHDLNNRLMVISANIDAVARQMKDQPAFQRKLLSALVASDQAASLIARSSAFGRRQELNIQYVDIAEKIDSIAALMSRSLLRDTVELRLSLAEGLWPIEVDPSDLDTAIVTLCANVRDALAQGEAITIEAQNVTLTKGTLSRADLEGDFVRISIGSTVLGEMLHDSEGGSESTFTMQGMDLSTWVEFSRCLHFLQPLGGMAEVTTIGAKSAIVLYLPRAKAPALIMPAATREEGAAGEPVRDHTEILVVDDEVEVALALQTMLEEFGYVTRIATNAGQVMKNLKTRKPGLLLSDVAMPGTMNGVMLAREVRQIFPGLPILLITGNPVVSEEKSEFPLLQKPIVSRNLHAAIQRHLTAETGKVVSLFPRTSRQMH